MIYVILVLIKNWPKQANYYFDSKVESITFSNLVSARLNKQRIKTKQYANKDI